MDERPHRYRNWAQGGQCVFATTTCLDFVHAFGHPLARDLMALSLLDDCARYAIPLNAYVVMPHHIHMLMQMPEGRSIGWVMNRLKSNSARRVLRVLDLCTMKNFDQQRGLNDRVFWMARYRSVVVSSTPVFWQKARYIHENPVRAGLVERPESYRWSSACAWADGLWSDETGLLLEPITEEFENVREFVELRSLRG